MKLFTRKFSSIIILILISVSTACSHTEKKVEEKIASEPKINNSAELGSEAHFLIESNSGFTAEQREKLFALQQETHLKLTKLREESLKIRMLLIEEVTGENYSGKELAVVKNKLKKNEDEKLQTYFHAIHKANDILGRKSERQKRIDFMSDFIGMHDRF